MEVWHFKLPNNCFPARDIIIIVFHNYCYNVTISCSLCPLSHLDVLGCNSAWSQPGTTAFLFCAGNIKNIMFCTVTSAKICCCAAVSLTLLGERVDGKAPVSCSRLLGCTQTGPWFTRKTLLFSGWAFAGVLNWQSAKPAWKLQVLNLSPPPSLLSASRLQLFHLHVRKTKLSLPHSLCFHVWAVKTEMLGWNPCHYPPSEAATLKFSSWCFSES